MKNRKKYCKLIVLLLMLPAPIISFSQTKAISVSFSNNATSFPVTGYPQLFYSQFHPGLDVAKEWKLNNSEKHQLWATANAGVFYHRFIQTGLRLYPAIDYRYFVLERLNFNIGLGAGYLHSFEGYEVFNPKDGGGYETKKIWIGRPQFTAVINLGCAYKLLKDKEVSPALFFQFHTNMQGPFVKSYVPLLPVNSAHLGISLPLVKD